MAAPTQQEVTRVITGMNSAQTASDYADSIEFEPEQITGTRYRYILTDPYTPPNGN
jgi:hypothetical protein